MLRKLTKLLAPPAENMRPAWRVSEQLGTWWRCGGGGVRRLGGGGGGRTVARVWRPAHCRCMAADG